jgi:ABC-type branched-subunit amino acid transport system substrate-binding protein
LDGTLLAMNRHGMQPVAMATVERNSVDVKEAVKKISEAKPDAIIMVSAYSSVAQFVREMRATGQRPLFYNVSFVGSLALSQALGKDGAGVQITQVVPFPWARSVPVVREYQEAMIANGDRNFDFTSLEGYIAARVMARGLESAGKALTRARFIEAMNNMRNFDMGGFIVSFSSTNHSGSTMVDTTIIDVNGGFVH